MHIPEGEYNLKEFCRVIIDSPESVLSGYHGKRVKSFLYLSDTGWKDYLDQHYETYDYGQITKFVGVAWDGSASGAFETADEVNVSTQNANNSDNATIKTGPGSVDPADSPDSSPFTFTADERITITMIDRQSGEIIFEREIRV